MAEIKSSIHFEIPIEGEEIFWTVKVILEVSSMINTYTAQSHCITMTRKKERIGSFIIYIEISFVHCSDFVLQNTEYSWLSVSWKTNKQTPQLPSAVSIPIEVSNRMHLRAWYPAGLSYDSSLPCFFKCSV